MFFKSSSRRVRTPPAGFVRPAQPTLVARPPSGSAWLHEVKHDGYRLIALKEGARVKLWTRHCTDYTSKFPRIADAVRALPTERALIDGEAVVFRPDGLSDFTALVTRQGAERASFLAFDLLTLEGEDLRLSPLEGRRAALLRLVGGLDGVLFSETIEGEGELVFAKACEMGLEGIVSKRAGSFYKSGRCRNWLKSKNPAFVRTRAVASQ
jgi:bifunctional non-homologous end joining protein LigD